jgi:hypothetical protein
MGANWSDIASIATAGGTLILAIATFSAVRSANRSARVAERAFQVGLSPVLASSRLEDLPQKIMFGDRHWVSVKGGRAAIDVTDDAIYLAMLVRNIGAGLAIIEAWRPVPGQLTTEDAWGEIDDFTPQQRSLIVPAGDVTFWQGALRDPSAALFAQIREAISEGAITVDLLYRDREGGHRTMCRFAFISREQPDNPEQVEFWTQLARHRVIDE